MRAAPLTATLGLLALTALTSPPGSAATPYDLEIPAGWPEPALPPDNPLTAEGVELGELLFADRRLSARHRQSCVTCHRETLAFSDGRVFATGVNGIQGQRSSMPIFNQAWHPAFAWDGSRPRPRDQAIAAVTSEIEMGADPAVVENTLQADDQLRPRFIAAFGSADVTIERISLALEQFMFTLLAHDSRYDRAQRGGSRLNAEEKRGEELFFTPHDPARGLHGAACFQCHGGPLFSDHAYRNNGLDLIALDRGRALVTGQDSDLGKFKTPSLRNVGVTGPYMHNGRFGTLEQVVLHYAGGIQPSPTLDPILAAQPPGGIALTPDDQRALVAFLRTLTEVQLEAPAR